MTILSYFLIVYGIIVLYLTLSKSRLLLQNPKTKLFQKFLGEKGTYLFFLLFGLISLLIGVLIAS